jgi:hydrophobic/amphiphilic exporter-1 (mainly G- bacteria), HAE1 family
MMYDLTSDATTESFTITSPYLYNVLYNQLENKVVKENAQLKLSDIASISIKKKAFEAIAHYDNEETIVLNVYKTSGTNTNKLVKEVENKMADISIDNVKIDAFNNQGSFITDSIMSVLDSLLIGGALAIIILLLFLHNIKGSVMVAISIPLSLLMTIDLMYIFNVPLNVISLGGMAVATGMVVDAAIVITERLYYYHSIEDDAGLVSVKATKSVGGAVLASTITTIAVFLPITFTEGFTKSVFEQIAYVVTFALIASCLVAFTIVPLLFKVFYQNKEEEEKYKTRKISDVFTAFASKFAKKFLAIYHSIISFVVRFHKSVLFLSVVGMAVIFVFLIPKIGFEFLPETDQSKVTIDLTMPSGTSLTETEKTVKIIENRLSGMEEIEHVYVTIGDKEFAVSDTYSSNLASFTINVTPSTERSTSLSDIANEMKTRLAGIECESLLIEQVDNFGSDITGGSMSDYLADVAIQVQCENRDDLDDYVSAVTKVLEDRGDLTNIKTDLGVGAQEARLTYDYEKITKMGLSSELNPAAVSQALYAAVDGTKLMSITYNEESYELVIGYQESQVQSVSDILDLVVYSYDDDNDALTPNKYIYLKDIASVQYVTGYSTLTRINNYSAATVYARITSDMTSGKMNQALEKSINDLNFPDSVKIVYKGSNHFMNEAFSGLLVALCISVVLVYAVMAIQFQSFKVPLIIMLSLPMGFTGSIVLCYFLGYSLNVCSFIGMIMLVGVVVNNAIVLLDRVKQMRDEGQKRQDAIINSSCERLRPILMTSLTTIFGLLPLIFTISSGIGTLLASLSAVVAGGMVTSTLLTLIVIPSAYETFSHYDENKYKRKLQNNN